MSFIVPFKLVNLTTESTETLQLAGKKPECKYLLLIMYW